jgi:hypothetical protein
MEISIIFLMVLFFFPLMAITMEKIFKFAVFYISIQIFWIIELFVDEFGIDWSISVQDTVEVVHGICCSWVTFFKVITISNTFIDVIDKLLVSFVLSATSTTLSRTLLHFYCSFLLDYYI